MIEMEKRKEEILKETFEKELPAKFTDDEEKLAVIDAFLQFSQNPTSASAGYGIYENYPLIGQNLARRYKLGKIVVEKIITFLRESFEKMQKINYDVYFWREAISDYIMDRYGEKLINWYKSLYEKLSDNEKKKFLFLLYALTKTQSIREIHKWFICFFDKEERTSEDDVKNLLVKFGLGNILYYKSSRGYVEHLFVPCLLREDLCKKFEENIPIDEDQIREFFDNLLLNDIKLIERCIKETVPVLESKVGKVTQTAPLILEASRSYFAIAPFALTTFTELIKAKKLELTREWKEKLYKVLNNFVRNVYPCAELKIIFEIDGAYSWEVKYTDSPEKEPISVGILLSPYIFNISRYSTILDEMRRVLSPSLNLVFLIKETLPAITESFRLVSQRNLIFLLDEKEKKFYVIERRERLTEDKAIIVDSFLSILLPILESEIQISRTWPSHLKEYMENLKYLNQFPRLVRIRNRIRGVEVKLRKTLRKRFSEKFGENWKEKVKEKMSRDVQKLERVIKKRPDKENIKDFLDGATLGELVKIARTFSDVLGIDRSGLAHLDLITKYRSPLEHPLEDQESDLDEKTAKMLNLAIDYVGEVICTK